MSTYLRGVKRGHLCASVAVLPPVSKQIPAIHEVKRIVQEPARNQTKSNMSAGTQSGFVHSRQNHMKHEQDTHDIVGIITPGALCAAPRIKAPINLHYVVDFALRNQAAKHSGHKTKTAQRDIKPETKQRRHHRLVAFTLAGKQNKHDTSGAHACTAVLIAQKY